MVIPARPEPKEEERERLLVEQLPQVRYIARRIHERLPRHVPLEDLVHAGVVGLIDALQKYDRGKHVQFGSYAKFRIRGAILDSLRELDWSPRDLQAQSAPSGGGPSQAAFLSRTQSQRARAGGGSGHGPARPAASAGRNFRA